MVKHRFAFHMGRVHVAPNRDWTLYLDLWGLQIELNVALPPRKPPIIKKGTDTRGTGKGRPLPPK